MKKFFLFYVAFSFLSFCGRSLYAGDSAVDTGQINTNEFDDFNDENSNENEKPETKITVKESITKAPLVSGAKKVKVTDVPSKVVDASRKKPEVEETFNLLLGEATPFSKREPLLKAFSFEMDIHFGLVGTGPTRFRNYIRYGLFDWWEIHTTLAPYPASLMNRWMLGSHNGEYGALLLDAGLASFDAGVRLSPDAGEPQVGVRFHFESGLAYSKHLMDNLSVFAQASFRYRYSMLKDDEQNAIQSKIILNYNLLRNFSLTGGIAYAGVIGTPVRELAISFVDVSSSGFNHFLLRDDGWSRSVTLPLSLRYGRVSSFDVDLFITPRIWPQFDVVFGAGLRWRIVDIRELWI